MPTSAGRVRRGGRGLPPGHRVGPEERLRPPEAVRGPRPEGRPGRGGAARRDWAERVPADAAPHAALGNFLRFRRKDYRGGRRLPSGDRAGAEEPQPWNDLGFVLGEHCGDHDGAAAAYRTAIDLDPKTALYHANLAVALFRKKDYDGVIAAGRKVVELAPDDPRGYERLSMALAAAGREAEGRKVLADAMTKFPAAAADPRTQMRYNAACFAVRAGDRQLAYDGLAADLAAWKQLLADDAARNAPLVRGRLGHWLTDSDLAPVRDPDKLAALPAAERAPWEHLWAEVRKLVADAAPREVAPPPRTGQADAPSRRQGGRSAGSGGTSAGKHVP